MSARAASRLATLGFTDVYRYQAGKADWFAAGLPREGAEAHVPRVTDLAERDVPTCGLQERVGDLQERVRAAGRDVCVVVDAEHGAEHPRGAAGEWVDASSRSAIQVKKPLGTDPLALRRAQEAAGDQPLRRRGRRGHVRLRLDAGHPLRGAHAGLPIAELPAQYRGVPVLRDVEGLSTAEVAACWGSRLRQQRAARTPPDWFSANGYRYFWPAQPLPSAMPLKSKTCGSRT
jgi:hypothetical protein